MGAVLDSLAPNQLDNEPTGLCDKISEPLRSSFYRAAQIVNLMESIAAILCIIVVLCKYRKRLTFHRNITVLIYVLIAACFTHAVVFCIAKIYQLSISFFVVDNCHVLLPRSFYMVTHTLIVYSNCAIQNVQLAMVIERIAATVFVDTYEFRCGILGAALAVVLVIATSVEVAGGVKRAATNEYMTNSFIQGQSNYTTTFAVICTICCLTLLITMSLYCFNSRRGKRKTLTSRYQTSENVSTSALLCALSSTSLITFAVYASGMTYLGLKHSDNPMLDAYKEAVYMVPLCTFLIPIVTIIFIKISKHRRRRGISGLLAVKSRGPDGWKNYAKMLHEQWK